MPRDYVPRHPYKNPGERIIQFVDLYTIFYQYRILWIAQPISDDFANQILAIMLFLDAKNSKDMNLYIGCVDGDLTPTLAIYDTMQKARSDVGTANIGAAFGSAGFLLAAGTKGKRFSYENAFVMLQPPAASTRGQASDIINETRELLRQKDYMMERLAEHTGHSFKKVEADLKRNRYFNAEMAKSYGIIDHIVVGRGVKAKDVAKKTEEAARAGR